MKRNLITTAFTLLAAALPAQHSPQELEAGPRGISTLQGGGGGPTFVTASYSLFGDACGIPCAAQNDTRAALRTGTLPNEYAFGHRFSTADTVVGFQLYTRTNTLPQATMTCSLFRESPTTVGVPDVNPVASGTLTATNGVDFYTVMLNAPVSVSAGETIWIHQADSTNILAAGLASAGTAPTIKSYYRRSGVSWTASVTVLYPAWRILCANNLVLSNSAAPKLGTTMTLNMQGGPAGAPAVLFFGVSNPNLATPFCTKLLSGTDIAITLATDPSGAASFQVAIPNDPALDGGAFYNQMWAITPTASLVGTNGGFGTLGT